MSSAWTDNDDTDTFWKYVKDLRDDESIVKEELPDRLKDAASENPDLFIRLVDEMIHTYETKRSRLSRKPVSRRGSCRDHLSLDDDHRGGLFGRMTTTETDDLSHCQSVCDRSVISYSHSMDEVEISFDPGQLDEIQIYNSFNAEHNEIEPKFPCDIAHDNDSIAKSIIRFEPDSEAIEVARLTVDIDDNASQVSNLSYATEVASMIRNLRNSVAGNSRLAFGVAREMDEASFLRDALAKKGNGSKKKKMADLEGSEARNLRKTRSRSPMNEFNVGMAPSDIRDDVSLLSENEFSLVGVPKTGFIPQSPLKSKGRKGMFHRILNKSKNLSRSKPKRDKVVEPSSSEVSSKVTKQYTGTVQPHSLSIQELEATKNEQIIDKMTAEKKQEQEVHPSTTPLPVTVAPYSLTHIPTPALSPGNANTSQFPNLDTDAILGPAVTSRQGSPHHSVVKNHELPVPLPGTAEFLSNNRTYDEQSTNNADKSFSGQDSKDDSTVFAEGSESSDDRGTGSFNEREELLLSDEDESELHVVATVKLFASTESEGDCTDDEIMAILGEEGTRSKWAFNSPLAQKKRKAVRGNNNDSGNRILSEKKEKSKVELLTDLAEVESSHHIQPNPPGKLPMRSPNQSKFPTRSPANNQRRSSKSPSRKNSPRSSAKSSTVRSLANKSNLDDFLSSVLGTFDNTSLGSPKSRNSQPLIEIIDSDEKMSYKAFAKQEPQKTTLGDGGTPRESISRWFGKEFMDMAIGFDPTRSIDNSISDGYSQEDSLGSYSSYSMSADGWSDEGNPAAAILDAVQSMFGVR
eukprot:scaffold1238_cov143-Amphora_coffeaeformis.AAC.2